MKNLITYLRENSHPERLSYFNKPEQSKHESIRKRIKQNPSLVGITHYEDIQSFDEVEFPRGDRIQNIYTPDLVFVADSDVYVVEIKAVKSKNTSYSTAEKLRDAYLFIRSNFDIHPYTLIAFGKNGNELDIRDINFRVQYLDFPKVA